MPRRPLSVPRSRRRLETRLLSQFPVAHRPSLPQCSSRSRLAAIPGPRDQRPSQRAPDLEPSDTSVPKAPRPTFQTSAATGRHHHHPGPCPAKRPPPHIRVRPGPISTQARASATGGFEHWPTNMLAAILSTRSISAWSVGTVSARLEWDERQSDSSNESSISPGVQRRQRARLNKSCPSSSRVAAV